MLVKKSIIEKWYQTDSWVYRNFSFLFKNPLWSKRVPAGFSVCPYFWLSLFSFFIFKPFFVAPIHYGIRPLLRLIGKPATFVDGLCRKLLVKIGGEADRLEAPGMSIFFVLLLTFLFGSVLTTIAFLGFKLVALYAYLKGFSAGIFAFWSGLSFIAMWLTLGIHKMATDTDCKTMNYLWIWLALFLVASGIFVPTEIIGIFSGFGTGVWSILVAIGIALWKGIVIGATWIGKMFMFLLNWKLWAFFGCPIIGLTIIGWLGDKVLSFLGRKQKDHLLQVNPQELYAQYRASWIGLFTRILMESKHYKRGDEFETLPSYKEKACRTMSYSLYRAAFEHMWKDKLDKLQTTFPSTKWDELRGVLKLDGTESRFRHLHEALNGTFEPFYFDISTFGSSIKAVMNTTFKKDIEDLEESYRKQDERRDERKEARKNSWSHLTCLKFTTAIGNGASSVGRGLKKLCKLLWWIVCEIGTFFAYMWTLVKAKKQGACPYILFQAPTNTLTNDPK